MSILELKQAGEKHLALLTPALPTSYEGVDFTPPATMYQVIQFRINSPYDPVFGTGYYREQGQIQIFVVDELGKGTKTAIQRAELVREHFKKGTVLSEGNVKIHILRTPHIAGAVIADSRLVVPVIINVQAEVYED